MSSKGVEERFPTTLGLLEEFKLEDEEKQLIQRFAVTEVKEEVDSDDKNQLKNDVNVTEVKEEVESDVEQDAVRAAEEGDSDDHGPRLEISPVAVQHVETVENSIDVPRKQAEDEVADAHQEQPEEEINFFLNQVQNDDVMNENVLLAEDDEFDESNAEIHLDGSLSVAEHGVLAVQAEPPIEEAQLQVEEHEESNFLGEKEGVGDEQQVECGGDLGMTVDKLLETLGGDNSMIALRPLHNNDVLFDSEDSLNGDLQMEKDPEDGNGEDIEDDEKVEEFEEEEEELMEEQKHEDNTMEKDVEDENTDDVNMDEEEEDSGEEKVDDDDDVSSDEESDEEKPAQKTKQGGRPTGNSIGRHLFTCFVKNCSTSYKTFKKLEEHVKSHTGKKDFFCDVCKKKFSSKDAATAHIQERKKMECCGCGKKFSHTSLLIQHHRSHTGEKPFVCKTCGRGFSISSNLKVHMLTHTGEKPFSCGYCKKRFALKHTLERHERTHTGDKPFKCSHCDYRSGDSGNLVVHNRIHTGDKPHRCGYCEKRFSQTSDLKKHEMTHSGEKPFECKDCGRRFNRKGHLKEHIRIHTGEKPYSCKECDADFAQWNSLKYHMKKNHQ